MNPKEYLEGVLKTESVDFDAISERLRDRAALRLLHASMGIGTEAGELVDQIKKHAFYGRELDKENLFEEIGDLLWYIGIALDELGYTFEDAMAANHRKLAARYNKGFSKKSALNRDLEQERKALLGETEGNNQ